MDIVCNTTFEDDSMKLNKIAKVIVFNVTVLVRKTCMETTHEITLNDLHLIKP